MTKLVAIHRIQLSEGKKRYAVPPGAIFDVGDEEVFDQLTSGEAPAARAAKESDIALAAENDLKIEVRPRRIMTIREINARKAAALQMDDDDKGAEEADETKKTDGKKAGGKKRDLT